MFALINLMIQLMIRLNILMFVFTIWFFRHPVKFTLTWMMKPSVSSFAWARQSVKHRLWSLIFLAIVPILVGAVQLLAPMQPSWPVWVQVLSALVVLALIPNAVVWAASGMTAAALLIMDWYRHVTGQRGHVCQLHGHTHVLNAGGPNWIMDATGNPVELCGEPGCLSCDIASIGAMKLTGAQVRQIGVENFGNTHTAPHVAVAEEVTEETAPVQE